MCIALKCGHTGVWKFDVRLTDPIVRSIFVKSDRLLAAALFFFVTVAPTGRRTRSDA